jgi:fatty-acyl-CoA synthase
MINLTGPCRVTADSTCLTVLPLFHVGGLDVYANPVFHYGGKVLVERAYDPVLTLRLFTDTEANVTHFIGAPAHFQFMAQLPQFPEARFRTCWPMSPRLQCRCRCCNNGRLRGST